MNIEAAIAQHDAATIVENSERKPLLVMPHTPELPNDGVLEYVSAESVYDFGKLEPGVVVQIATDKYDVLKLVADNQILFGVQLRVLSGVPGADYDTEFDQVTWSLERIAYAPYVSELALEIEVEKQGKLDSASQHDRERAQFTRADGTVKPQTAFSVAKDKEYEDEEFSETDA